MYISEEIIADKFEEYNKMYFDSELPTPSFGVIKSFKYYGLFSCKEIIGRRALKKPKIELSCYYDWTDDVLRDIMVHEMIHYYLAYKHIDNTLSHGDAFLEMSGLFNKKHGLNIKPVVEFDTLGRGRVSKLKWVLGRLL